MSDLERLLDQAKALIPEKRKKTNTQSIGLINAPKRDNVGMVIYETNLLNKAKQKIENRPSTSYAMPSVSSAVNLTEINPQECTDDEFLIDVLQQLNAMEYDSQPTPTWKGRRQQQQTNWEEKRAEILAAFVNAQFIPSDRLCFSCHEKPAVIRCLECLPECYICEDCDKDRHGAYILHDRELYNNAKLQPLSPQNIVVRNNGNLEQKVVEKLCPVLQKQHKQCDDCQCDVSIVPGKPCILVNLKGRFDVYLPKFMCNKCGMTKDANLSDVIEAGFFPALANISAGMYLFSQELLTKFDLLRKEAPGLSVNGFITSYSLMSEENGRCSVISQTSFMDALREWRYLKYSLQQIQDVDPFVCPACHSDLHSIHCDGNRKLYRYDNKRHDTKANYYGAIFIEEDKKVNSFVEQVTGLGVQDGGNQCGNSHWQAMKATSKTMAKQSETGLVMACCRHNVLLKSVNMFRGEIYAYPLYLQHTMEVPVNFVCQDVICKYWPYLRKLTNKMDIPSFNLLLNSRPFLSVMHAKAHGWKCQIEYGGRYQIGSGLSSGEEMEQTNSYMSRAGFITKNMTKSGREEELTELAMSWNSKKIRNLTKTLVKRYTKVDLQLPTAISDLSEFLTKLQVNIDAVKNWREELTVLAKEKSDCIEQSMNQIARLYFTFLQIKEAEKLQSFAEGENQDINLYPDQDIQVMLSKKAESLPKLKSSYAELLQSLLHSDSSESDLLQRGRIELAVHKMQGMEKKIEMACQSIRQKEYELYNVKDSGVKRSRIRTKLRSERTFLAKHVKEYNTFVEMYPFTVKQAINQEMQDKQEWPWTLHGETNLTNKRTAVELFNMTERLREEQPILKQEMKKMCRYLLHKIKALEDISANISNGAGKYVLSNLCKEAAVASLRRRRSHKLKQQLAESVDKFQQCITNEHFANVSDDSDDEEDFLNVVKTRAEEKYASEDSDYLSE